MKIKTQIQSDEDKQELLITRAFDLPIHLLFKAFIDPDIVSQWMGTKVIKLDIRKHGSYQFITTDPMGNKHGFNGVIHEFVLNKKITRTFEMENSNFPVQLEFLTFHHVSEETSELKMHIIYKSVEYKNQMLQLPFAQGINMAHNRLQAIVKKLDHE
ncbi:SRPBCC domain-containing protein [Portibacter lacus]|uniref:Activator of Hsp90 ATPase homologue 1/2-like C-terminal domain-containing protein n=1 Tax=Portibacter lacus TaxID=1099794 RepID=A0AA37WER6_9BACT|nr:SRPBCC domain-containing protein [Portibacter lacus]GLR19076.1 hypothetical protein GCM10007940_36920 [Portibacter lacus]